MSRRRLLGVSLVLAAALGAVVRAQAGAVVSGPLRPVTLPGDHGAHPHFSIEWWYTAGTVAASAAHPYFWFATVWRAAEGMIARVNVVDLRRDRVVLSRQYLTPTPPAAGQTALRVGGFALSWRAGGPRGRWSVEATATHGSLSLALRPTQPYLLHGRRGIVRQGANGLSAYYSEPRLAARGVLDLGTRRIAVRGEGWLDHQWGDFLAMPASLRWNWFACQLRDGRSLMLYEFLTPQDRPSGILAGTLADGHGEQISHLHHFTAAGLRPFIRPAGAHARYPLRWRLRIPAFRLALTLRARARHQYIANTLIPSFWEGAARVTAGPPGECIVESSREVPTHPRLVNRQPLPDAGRGR